MCGPIVCENQRSTTCCTLVEKKFEDTVCRLLRDHLEVRPSIELSMPLLLANYSIILVDDHVGTLAMTMSLSLH